MTTPSPASEAQRYDTASFMAFLPARSTAPTSGAGFGWPRHFGGDL